VSRETQLWIMVDLETSGPVIGTHSMTELAGAAGSPKHGVISRFEAVLQPIGTEVVSGAESFAKAKKEGKPPDEVMKAFAAWCVPFMNLNGIFVARPSAFDWPWIVWYARTFLGNNPFGYKVVCAMSWDLAKGRKFGVRLSRNPARDAENQLNNFLKDA